MLKKFKKGFILFLCATFIFSLPNISVYANTLENMKLSKFIEKEELRVQEINNLYSKKQELYNKYFQSNDIDILTDISYIESQLYKLGVSDFSWNEMEQKLYTIGYENTNNPVTPNIPKNIKNTNVKMFFFM